MYKTQFQIKLDENNEKSLTALYTLFSFSTNKELYLVGGCVRDFILGKEPNDIDLCTNATPDEVKEIVEKHTNTTKIFDSGIKHGTVTIIDYLYKTSYEITTFRNDGKYSDGRHPDAVEFTSSLEEDLKRRDLTINSLAYNLSTKELIMLDVAFMKDLELGIIRCVGDANERFKEDALRMLRAIRFSAQLGYSIEKDTFNAIKINADLIQNISAERIKDELTKILCSNNPQMLEMLIATGLHRFIMPELEDMLNCKQINKYHYTDVLHHTFDVMKNLPKDNVKLRWSALFHDMGKPDCVTVGEDGYEHFYGHALLSADKVKKYAQLLKFDNATTDFVYTMVKYHDREMSNMKNKTFKDLVNTIGKDRFNDYLMFRQADALAHSHDNNPLEAVAIAKERYKNLLLHPEPMLTKDLAINGNDLKNIGLEGKEIGIALALCLETILENPERNTKEFLLNLVGVNKHE